MKYIRDKSDKFRLQCEHYYHVTHGGDCCSIAYDKSYNCRGYPCYIEMNNDMLDMLEDNDITWAVQNLQSNNQFIKIIAEYILMEHNE